jgi:ribosomal protein S18 acetylase RimI-like enzyme
MLRKQESQARLHRLPDGNLPGKTCRYPHMGASKPNLIPHGKSGDASMAEIEITREARLPVREFLDVLHRSGLAERRPVNDLERIVSMLEHANLFITARDEGRIVGVSRCATDFSYFCYCSDLAVDKAYQRQGLGKRLLAATRAELHPQATLYLIAAPAAISYYEHLGMTRHDRCFAFLPDNRV